MPYLPREVQRFEERVIKSADCWEWSGTKLKTGEGRFSVGGRKVYARRFSYLHFKGMIPRGKIVAVSCRNKSCVNPAHLTLTTYSSLLSQIKKEYHAKKETEKDHQRPAKDH